MLPPSAAAASAGDSVSNVKWIPETTKHKISFWLDIKEKNISMTKWSVWTGQKEKLGNVWPWELSRPSRAKPCTTWSVFIVHSSLGCGSDQRLPKVRSHLYDSVLTLWISFSLRLPALEVTFLPTGKEIHLQENAPLHTSVSVQTYTWTQGGGQRPRSNLEGHQGPEVHRFYRLRWKIKRNTCVLLGPEHPGRRELSRVARGSLQLEAMG